MGKDYYKILGLQRTATEDEIKKAYKKLALKVNKQTQHTHHTTSYTHHTPHHTTLTPHTSFLPLAASRQEQISRCATAVSRNQ